MDDSPIYRLPIELRFYIYELVLAQQPHVEICSELDFYPDNSLLQFVITRGLKDVAGLMRGSKQIYTESLPIIFSCSRVVIRSPLHGWEDDCDGPGQSLFALYKILREIRRANPSKVHLTIDLESYDMSTLTQDRDMPAVLIELSHQLLRFPRGSLLIKLGLEFLPSTGLCTLLSFTFDCRDLYQSMLAICEDLHLQALAYPLERLWLMSVSRQFHPQLLGLVCRSAEAPLASPRCVTG